MSSQGSPFLKKYASFPTSPTSHSLPKAASALTENGISLASHDVIDLGWFDETDDKGTVQLNPRVRTIRFASAAANLDGKLSPRQSYDKQSPAAELFKEEQQVSKLVQPENVEIEPLTPADSQDMKASSLRVKDLVARFESENYSKPCVKDLVALFDSEKVTTPHSQHYYEVPVVVTKEKTMTAKNEELQNTKEIEAAQQQQANRPGHLIAEKMKIFEASAPTIKKSRSSLQNPREMASAARDKAEQRNSECNKGQPRLDLPAVTRSQKMGHVTGSKLSSKNAAIRTRSNSNSEETSSLFANGTANANSLKTNLGSSLRKALSKVSVRESQIETEQIMKQAGRGTKPLSALQKRSPGVDSENRNVGEIVPTGRESAPSTPKSKRSLGLMSFRNSRLGPRFLSNEQKSSTGGSSVNNQQDRNLDETRSGPIFQKVKEIMGLLPTFRRPFSRTP